MDDAVLEARLGSGMDLLGLERQHLPALMAYLVLLRRWNDTYNLTAIRDPAEMVTKHLLDSLTLAPHLAGDSLVDIGTGPGLPGIPLALACPELRVALVETAGKKARFLREAVRQLGLAARVTVHACRAEHVSPEQPFAQLTARALGRLAEIIRLGGHLLVPGGRLLAMKGRVPEDELAELPAGWRHRETRVLRVPGLDAERHLILIEKLPAAPSSAENQASTGI